MKRIMLNSFLWLICAFLFLGCGSGNRISDSDSNQNQKYIIIKENARRENFTNDQLKNFIKKTPGKPAIVIRSSGSVGNVSSSSSSDRMCSLLEMALAKHDFDVRDRALFESAVLSHERSSNSLESGVYYNMYKATGVDLLMEISSYSLNDYYYVTGYYDQKGRFKEFDAINEGTDKDPRWIHPRYVFRGMSLTVKVIVLKDNLVGGSYSYAYIPCSEESGGALITNMYPLRYRVSSEARDLDAILDADRNNHLLESRSQRLDRAMEDFIYKVVGWITDDMKGIHNEEHDVVNHNDSYNQEEIYSLSSLLKVYNIQEMLKNYEKAVLDNKRRLAEDIKSDLSDIEKEVSNSPIIPISVQREFIDYIESSEEKIERESLAVGDTRKDKKRFSTLFSKTKKGETNSYKDSQLDDYSLESLLEAYDIQSKLDRYKEAVSSRNKKEQSAIESELWSIETRVKDNPLIPKSVGEEFVDYIESAEDDIEKESHKPSSHKKKNSKQVITNTTTIIPVNSYGKFSSAISRMIEMKLDEKMARQKSMCKSQRELAVIESEWRQLENDYNKWKYLDYNDLIDINQLVLTSSNAAGLESPHTDVNHVSFYLPMMIDDDANDAAIYLFLEGKCIGAGTNRKGFYVDIDLNNSSYSDSFHQLHIYTVNKTDKVKLFESLVRLDLRNSFTFERDMSRRQLKELDLK